MLLRILHSTSSSASAANQNSDLNFKEQFVGESFGRINKAEAELTLLTLAEYFTKIGKQRVLEREHRRRHHFALSCPGAVSEEAHQEV